MATRNQRNKALTASHYKVQHTGLGGFSKGDVIERKHFEDNDIDIQRLLDLEAMAPHDPKDDEDELDDDETGYEGLEEQNIPVPPGRRPPPHPRTGARGDDNPAELPKPNIELPEAIGFDDEGNPLPEDKGETAERTRSHKARNADRA